MQDPTVTGPSLTQYAAPARPAGVVLLLHGGKERSRQPVDGRSASWRRASSLARSIAAEAETAGAALWLLRYRHRGWNGGTGAIQDARWALDRVREEAGDVPIVLLGHSMGARTSIHVADDPQVRGVVALAPWFPLDEPVAALAGRTLVAAHGRSDHITSPRATRAFVERARTGGADASYVDMGRVGHYLLRQVPRWNELAATESLRLLG